MEMWWVCAVACGVARRCLERRVVFSNGGVEVCGGVVSGCVGGGGVDC